MSDDIKVTVSGSTWMGSGIGSIRTALQDLFATAENQVVLVTYSISYQQDIVTHINQTLEKGIRLILIINRFENQHVSIKRHIKKLLKQYPTLLSVYSFDPQEERADLHAKIIIVDTNKALIGSANMSNRGLYDNHELGILLTGRVVSETYEAVKRLMKSPYIYQLPDGD